MIKIDPKIRQDLAKHGLLFDDYGYPRFNGGRFVCKEELKDIIKEYESGGGLESFIKKKGKR